MNKALATNLQIIKLALFASMLRQPGSYYIPCCFSRRWSV